MSTKEIPLLVTEAHSIFFKQYPSLLIGMKFIVCYKNKYSRIINHKFLFDPKHSIVILDIINNRVIYDSTTIDTITNKKTTRNLHYNNSLENFHIWIKERIKDDVIDFFIVKTTLITL